MKNLKVEGFERGRSNPENNTRKLYTGETLAKIEAINPDRDQIISIKGLENIADKVQDPTYTGIELKSGDFTKIEFLLSFKPAAFDVFVNYRVYISKELSTNGDGSKIQLIDDHNRSAWIPYDASKTAKDLLLKAQASDPSKEYYKKVDPDTCRFAKIGEVVLYDFLHKASWLPIHNPGKNIRLDGYVLGGDVEKASEVFDKIVDGDFSFIREFIAEEGKHDDDSPILVGVLLGVNVSDATVKKGYQEVFDHRFEACIFRHSDRERLTYIGEDEYTSHFGQSIIKRVVNEEYPWQHEWQGSFQFQEFSWKDYTPPVSDVSGETDDDDDLPF